MSFCDNFEFNFKSFGTIDDPVQFQGCLGEGVGDRTLREYQFISRKLCFEFTNLAIKYSQFYNLFFVTFHD